MKKFHTIVVHMSLKSISDAVHRHFKHFNTFKNKKFLTSLNDCMDYARWQNADGISIYEFDSSSSDEILNEYLFVAEPDNSNTIKFKQIDLDKYKIFI